MTRACVRLTRRYTVHQDDRNRPNLNREASGSLPWNRRMRSLRLPIGGLLPADCAMAGGSVCVTSTGSELIPFS